MSPVTSCHRPMSHTLFLNLYSIKRSGATIFSFVYADPHLYRNHSSRNPHYRLLIFVVFLVQAEQPVAAPQGSIHSLGQVYQRGLVVRRQGSDYLLRSIVSFNRFPVITTTSLKVLIFAETSGEPNTVAKGWGRFRAPIGIKFSRSRRPIGSANSRSASGALVGWGFNLFTYVSCVQFGSIFVTSHDFLFYLR